MIAIEARGVTKRYKDKTAVDSTNLEIKRGEIFSLLGTNGAGKTTMIKMLTSLIASDEGVILINGADISSHKNEIRKIINISPQETAVAPNLTVLENLDFMAGIYAIDNKSEKINALVKQFGLNEVLKQKAKTLSGGWKRKLSIALSLINEPEILFLDEPTAALDVIARRELWEVIKSLKGKCTIILTTHYMEEAQALSDRIGIMSKGKLKCTGTAQELMTLAGKDNLDEAFVALAV